MAIGRLTVPLPTFLRRKPRIRFGDRKDWADWIATVVDRDRFDCVFGPFDEAARRGFDAIVPLTIADYGMLERWPGDRGHLFWSPAHSLVGLCADKLSLNRHLLTTRFASLVPALYDGRTVTYPYISKPRIGEWGEDTVVIRDSGDEYTHASWLHGDDRFRQRFVAGDQEYALHMLIVRDAVAFHRTVAYEMGRDIYVKGRAFQPAVTRYLDQSPTSTCSRI